MQRSDINVLIIVLTIAFWCTVFLAEESFIWIPLSLPFAGAGLFLGHKADRENARLSHTEKLDDNATQVWHKRGA
jgi:hypothetical protein